MTKDDKPLLVVGGIVLQLWGGRTDQYFCLPLTTSNKGWHKGVVPDS
jgi:hypothetical protein